MSEFLSEEEILKLLEEKEDKILEEESSIILPKPTKIIGDVTLEEFNKYIEKNNFTPKEIGQVIWSLEKPFYKDKLVTIQQFCKDKAFLGETIEKNWPIWEAMNEKLYPHPLFSPYFEVIAETPIGSGKSTWAAEVLLYEVYKMAMLENPQKYYGLLRGTKIVFAVLSQDLGTVSDVNWSAIEGMISNSTFLSEIADLPKGKNPTPELRFPNGMSIKFASKPSHLTGRAIFGGICDEANVSRYIRAIYADILKRMNSRFPLSKHGGIIPGKLFLLSSPKEDGSFLGERINKKRPFTLVINNIPIWKVKDPIIDLKLCGKTFPMFIGNKLKEPMVITKKEVVTEDMVDFIMDIPIEFYSDFYLDPIESLREVAGIRTMGKEKLFRSEEPIRSCFFSADNNICKQEVIELDFYNTDDKLINYFDLNYFKDLLHPNSLRFMHIDVGINNDELGIGCVHAIEKESNYFTNHKDIDSMKTDRKYFVDFVFGLKKPKNEEICVPKLIDFILTLHNDFHFPLAKVTTDNYEGRVLRQFLRMHKIKTDYLSIDRDYAVWKFGKAQILLHNILGPFLVSIIKQCLGLENNGKTYDHPILFDDGTKGKHDIIQGLFGAIFNCGTADLFISSAAIAEGLHILSTEESFKQDLKNKWAASNKNSIVSRFTNNFNF